MELSIEWMFEVIRILIYYSLSPFKTLKIFISWLFFRNSNSGPDNRVNTAILCDSNPAPQKKVKKQQILNTDERTCEDVITSLGSVDLIIEHCNTLL